MVRAVPTVAPSPTPAAVATVAPATPTPAPTNASTYVVRKGDTLWSIAKAFGISLDALRTANPQVTDPTKMRVGTALTIPSS